MSKSSAPLLPRRRLVYHEFEDGGLVELVVTGEPDTAYVIEIVEQYLALKKAELARVTEPEIPQPGDQP